MNFKAICLENKIHITSRVTYTGVFTQQNIKNTSIFKYKHVVHFLLAYARKYIYHLYVLLLSYILLKTQV